MADEKKVSLLLSLKDGVSAGLSKIEGGWKKSMAAMEKSALFFAAGFAGTIAGIYQGIKAYGEQEEAVADLEAAMKNAGTFTIEASKDLQNYAQEMQRVTRFGDEQITSAQAMIASYGVQGKQLKDLTTATMNLATAKKMDLGSAADLVAKSVGGETNALARYGVIIDGAAGSTARAESAIKAISTLFGGRAQASALTFVGSIDRIKNQVSDMLETVGKPFIDVLSGMIGKLSNVIQAISPWVEHNAKLIAILASVVLGITGLLTALGMIITIAPTVAAAWVVITGPIGLTIGAIAGLTAATVYFSTSQSKLAENVRAVWDGIRGIYTGNIERIKAAWADLSESAKTHNAKIAAAQAERAAAEAAAVQKAADDAKAAAEKKAADELAAKEAEAARKEKAFALDQEFEQMKSEYYTELAAERFEFEQMTQEEKLQYLTDVLGRERIIRDSARVQELISSKQYEEAKKVQSQLYADAFLKSHIDKLNKAEAKSKAYYADDLQDLITTKLQEIMIVGNNEEQKRAIAEQTRGFMANLSTLSRSDNKTMFEVGKRAAQATALVNMYLSIAKAWGQLGPILGIPAAAAMAIVGWQNVRAIEQTQFRAASGAYGPGDGATVKFAESGNPEWIMNQGNIRALVREVVAESGGTVIVKVYIAGQEIQPAIVAIEKEKARMSQLGII